MTKIAAQLFDISVKLADVKTVLKRIERRIPSPYKRKDLAEKVETYNKTKDPRDDLSLSESRLLYPGDEMGDSFDIPKPAPSKDRRDLDVTWSAHSQYRSELRDIDSGKVNTEILNMAERMPNYHDDQKIKMQKPFGTAVLELNGRRPSDIEADVITVY